MIFPFPSFFCCMLFSSFLSIFGFGFYLQVQRIYIYICLKFLLFVPVVFFFFFQLDCYVMMADPASLSSKVFKSDEIEVC